MKKNWYSTLLLFCSLIILSKQSHSATQIQPEAFAPWDKTVWGSYYDTEGRVLKPFPINGDVIFETRTSPWELTLSPDFVGSTLFSIQGRGMTVDGNGVEIDATEAVHSQTLTRMYTAGQQIWDNIRSVSCIYYSQSKQSGVGATVIKNFTIKGFYRGVRLGNAGSLAEDHPVIVENCILARNVIGFYTNGNNILVQNSQIIENGFCGVYSGYRSRSNTFTNNTFRDNVLFQGQASYGDFVGDTYYNTNITDNNFATSLVNSSSLKHVGISIFRNEGESDNVREDIPHNNVISGNQFNNRSLAIHVASRMGRNPNYDLAEEGRDYAFYNQIKNNQFSNCVVGIKINSEGNTIDGNTFTNTTYPIVLHPVFFDLKNTTINNQSNETVSIWYVKSDYSSVPNQSYFYGNQDNINGYILRAEKYVEVFSTTGTPSFSALGGVKAAEFKLNPVAPEDLLWDHRMGNPTVKAYGEFQENLAGDEIVAVWSQKISRVNSTNYYSILIFDKNGTEINRSGRSVVEWSQLAVGYFTSMASSGEMEIAAVPKTAIGGKYPVYIFRRGRANPETILYPDNTDSSIKISSDSNHRLVVSFGNTQKSLLSWQFTDVEEGNNRGDNATGNTDGKETTIGSYITDIGLEPSYLKRGAGVDASTSLTRTFTGKFPNGGTESEAISNNRYYEFTVKAKSDFKVSLNTLLIKLRRSGATAPNTFKWMYSVNAVGKPDSEKVFTLLSTFTYSVIGDVTNGDLQTPINLSTYSALQNVDESKEITFRLYAWGATESNTSVSIGRFAFDSPFYQSVVLNIEGNVEPFVLPSTQKSLLSWQFTDVEEGNNRGDNATGNTNGKETTVGSYITDLSIERSYLTRGAGVELSSSLVRTFNGKFPDGGTEAEAISNNRYYEFTVKAKPDFKVSLSTLLIKLRRTGTTAPNTFKWMYSINATGKPDSEKVFTALSTFTYSVIEDATNGDFQAPIDLANFSALQNVDGSKEITIRLYAWGATATNTSVAIGRFSFDSPYNESVVLNVEGNVEPFILPVKLTSFTAKSTSNTIQLNWITASEQNNSYFEIFKVMENDEKQSIGRVGGKGTSSDLNNYSFIDYNPIKGENYYQLQQVDYNGTSNLSDVVMASFSLGNDALKVYAPPTEQYVMLFVNSNNKNTKKEVIIITDLSGRVLLKAPLQLEYGQNTIQLPILLSQGIYVAQLQNKTVKFIK